MDLTVDLSHMLCVMPRARAQCNAELMELQDHVTPTFFIVEVTESDDILVSFEDSLGRVQTMDLGKAYDSCTRRLSIRPAQPEVTPLGQHDPLLSSHPDYQV